MGQDICSNVTCVSQCYIIETPTLEILQESVQKHPTNRQSQQDQPKIQENPDTEKPERPNTNSGIDQSPPLSIEQIKIHEFDIKKELQHLKKLFSDQYPKAIYLSIDKTWQNEMRLQKQSISQSYTLQPSKGNKITYLRNGNNGYKRQILFRQHFPIFGTFYFQIQIESYELNRGCEFVIGVVNHLQASMQVHSRDRQYEQSFIFKRQNVIKAKEGELSSKKTMLRLQVDQKNKEIVYFVDNKQQKRQFLKKELIDELASLAPYIQTKYIGVVFSWEMAPLHSTKSYKMSTIIEEGSSSIITV